MSIRRFLRLKVQFKYCESQFVFLFQSEWIEYARDFEYFPNIQSIVHFIWKSLENYSAVKSLNIYIF